MEAKVPSLDLNLWYLDNGTLIVSHEDLFAAFKVIERDGPGIAKSLLYKATP